ncbi:PQ-loop repeat family protein [Striga asiatica]|uniref:Cystinosin homolog n=1 Tax=Striga asiatica TaxID=4170 RepID=A0A5A7PKB0_STRAF|nr:PQ-loop repeat family protein [Striga asiatica]
MASWDSVQLKVLYNVFGWVAFVSWSICFYPQILLNYRRKSVAGLNLDYALLNMVKQLAYLIYNVSILFSPTVKKQYHRKFGDDKMLPVAQSDLAFSIHVVLVSAFSMYQIAIYDRGTQKFSRLYVSIVAIFLLAAAVCVGIAIPHHSWFWLVSCLNTIQVVMTIVKYIPQASRNNLIISRFLNSCYFLAILKVVYNYRRKSTSGFSIGNVLLDLLGGIANNIQMLMQSIDQKSWENFYGNIGKSLLALVTIVFDLILMAQHYLLYPTKKAPSSPTVVKMELQRDNAEQC